MQHFRSERLIINKFHSATVQHKYSRIIERREEKLCSGFASSTAPTKTQTFVFAYVPRRRRIAVKVCQ